MVLNRNIIHSDFILYPHRVKREKFFEEIDRAKNYLSARFSKGDHITIGYSSNDVRSLAFIFASFELGIAVKVMSEPFFCGPEFNPERFEHLLTLMRDYDAIDGRWILDGMVNDRDDPILGGRATKRDIFGNSFQKLINELGVPNYYMRDYQSSSTSVIDIDVKSTDNATSYFEDGDWLSVPQVKFKSHEYILDQVNKQHIRFENKIVGLTKNMHHDNAMERLILPALMQSGRVVDFQIPEPDFGGFFITNNVITQKELFDYCIKYAHKMIDAYKVDIIMAPTDDTLFEFLSRRDKDFRKPLEIILHNEITSEHRWWESELNIKFVV